MKSVLLLTSHPLAPPWDSADKQLAVSIVRGVRKYRMTIFGRAGCPVDLDATRVAIWSRDGRPGTLERAQVALLSLALEPAVDLVHAVLSIGPGFSRFSFLRRKIPGALRRPAIHTVPGIRDPAFLRGAIPIGVTVVLSQASADQLRSAGFPDVRVIPPAVPLERWPMRERAQRDPALVLFAGHYDPGGGAEEAIRGAAHASRLEHSFRLVLAMRTRFGQSPAREAARLLEVAAQGGLKDIDVHGHVDDMNELVRQASVVVFPPVALHGKADLPLIVLEAMASGRPVVVSDLPPFAALGEAAIRVPPGDSESLGKAIASVLDDDARWAAQATAGRRLIEEQFSEAAMAAEYSALYDEVLAMRAA